MRSLKRPQPLHRTLGTKLLYYVGEAAEVDNVCINSWRELLWRKSRFLYEGKSVPQKPCIFGVVVTPLYCEC